MPTTGFPAPVLTDGEALTMEVVGEYLGLDRDTALFAYFRQHWAHFFPGLCRMHRTTFIRRAANTLLGTISSRACPPTRPLGCDCVQYLWTYRRLKPAH
jgi:hypothetical protein